MRGTIKRVGKIFHDGHGSLQMQGWEFSDEHDFTLQDLIYISEVYPEGGGPYTFGTSIKLRKKAHKYPYSIRRRR